MMDVGRILAEMRLEREQLEEAIASLERLAAGSVKRRGRPPAWLSEIKKKRKTGVKSASGKRRKPGSDTLPD
jgi:hypothetical protein